MRHSRLQVVLADEVRAFTWAELVSVSSKDAVGRAVANGSLVKVAPGVYADAHHASSFLVRASAAVTWAGGDGIVSGVAALHAWGFVENPPATVEVTVCGGSHKRPPNGISVRTTATALPRTSLRGLPVLTPADAVVRAFGAMDPADRGEIVFQAVRSRRVSAEQLQLALERTPKVAARRELARRIDATRRGAVSHLEEYGLRSVFASSEFARFVRQHRVVHEGSVYVLDMFDPVTRTAVELDGARWHSATDARERDIRRDAHLATLGIQTLRFSTQLLKGDPNWCRFVVLETLRVREKGLVARSGAA